MQSSRASAPCPNAGFSLVELMVAMVVTMIICGAIFGMMSVGQGAFKREPELVDRQDNIRIAMNVIENDLTSAGMGMGKWMQIFTQNLDGASAVVGPGGLVANGYSSNGHYSTGGGDVTKPDYLEFLAKNGTCPDVNVECDTGKFNGGAQSPCTDGAKLQLDAKLPACYGKDQFVYVVWTSGGGKWGVAHQTTGGTSGQDGVNFPKGQDQIDPCDEDYLICDGGGKDFNTGQAAPWDGQPQAIMSMSLIRYEIANETDPITNQVVPNLYRSELGGKTSLTGVYAAPPGGSWQLVARGIEDMQVVYVTRNTATGAEVVSNSPPLVTQGNYQSIVSKVRVTLGARTLRGDIKGAMRTLEVRTDTAGNQIQAVRGNLTRIVTLPAGLAAFAGDTTAPVSFPVPATVAWN
jgi:hypothetical protein